MVLRNRSQQLLAAEGGFLCWKKEAMTLKQARLRLAVLHTLSHRTHFWQLLRPAYQWTPACLSFPLLPSPPHLAFACTECKATSSSQKGELGAQAGAGLCLLVQLQHDHVMLRDTDIQKESGEEKLVYFVSFMRTIKCLAFVCAGLLLLSCQNWLCYAIGAANTSWKIFCYML